MPTHTPQEQARNAADGSTRPGLDRSGGAAAVEDDAGFRTRFAQWQEYLAKPEIQAGLLQFSVQMLQTNPGGVVPAFGQALGAGLGAVGRVSKLQREQGAEQTRLAQEQTEREAAATQQQLENALAERRVATQEQRTGILGRRGSTTKDTPLKELQTKWGAFVDSEAELNGTVLDPTTRRLRRDAGVAADQDLIMQAALATGKASPSDVIDAYLDPEKKANLRAALGFDVATPSGGDGGGDEEGGPTTTIVPEIPDAELSTEPGPARRGGIKSPSQKTARVRQLTSELEKRVSELAVLREKGVPGPGRGGQSIEDRRAKHEEKIIGLETRIDELRNRLVTLAE